METALPSLADQGTAILEMGETMQPKAQSGFTLIELMITLTVAAVLMVLAVPTFSDLIVKSRLRGATDDIVNLLNTSRGNAVKLGREINVSVKSATWCAGAISEAGPTPGSGNPLTLANASCDCAAGTVTCLVNGDNALVSSSNYSGVTLSVSGDIDIGSAASGVTFDPKFGALTPLPTTNSQVTLVNGKFSTRITVSPLGQTNVCVPGTSPFVSGYPSC